MLRLSPNVRIIMLDFSELVALLFSMSSLTTSSEPHKIHVCVPILSDTMGPSILKVRIHSSVVLPETVTLFRPLLEFKMQIFARKLV